jgi:hypothetical protein
MLASKASIEHCDTTESIIDWTVAPAETSTDSNPAGDLIKTCIETNPNRYKKN